MKTPNRSGFSRRDFLRGALGAGALAAVPGRLLFGCAASRDRATADPDGPRPTELRTLHFNLSHVPPGRRHVLHIGPHRVELVPHTSDSRDAHRSRNRFLDALSDEHLTHYAEALALPADAAQSFHVRTHADDGSLPALALAGIHLPRAAVEVARSIKGPSFRLHRRRADRHGYAPTALRAKAGGDAGTGDGGAAGDAQAFTLDDDILDYVDTFDAARFCIFHHNELLSVDGPTAALVMAHVDDLPETEALAEVIGAVGAATGPDDPYQGWAYARWSEDLDGERIPQLDLDGNPVLNDDGTQAYHFEYVQDPDVAAALGPAVRAALVLVRNDPALEGPKYVIHDGVHADEVAPDPGPDDAAGDDGGADSPPAKRRKAATGYGWELSHGGQWRHGQRVTVDGVAADRTVSFTVDNSYLRHLGVWATCQDAQGSVLRLGDLGLGGATFDTDHAHYLGMIAPPPRILGIPVVGMTSVSDSWSFQLPEQAAQLAIVTSALAFHDGDDWKPEYHGITTSAVAMTIVFELGFPTMMLATGVAGLSAERLMKKILIAAGPIVLEAVSGIIADQITGVKSSGWLGIALKLVNFVLKYSLGAFASILIGEISKAAAEEMAKSSLPFVGWVLFAIDVAVTVAELAQTITDAGLSRAAVASVLSITQDVTVTVLPDENDAEGFPATATSCEMTLYFDNGATPKTVTIPLETTSVAQLRQVFAGVPTGGRVKATTRFLSDSGWIAGQGHTGSGKGATTATEWTDNLAAGGAGLGLTIQIEENEVPLDEHTVYHHRKKLLAQGGAHAWSESAPAPTATRHACDCTAGGAAALCEPLSITVNNRVGRVGYAWQSLSPTLAACGGGARGTQLFQAQSLNFAAALGAGAPDAARRTFTCGFDQPVHLVYSPIGPADGFHFVLAPRDGEYHAFRVNLDGSDPLDVTDAPSWGRFATRRVRSVALHPSGYIAVLNGDYSKIEVLRLFDPAQTGIEARPANLLSGPGSQRGNITAGRGVAATHDGHAFLVLEDAPNRRIQALDEQCHPTPYFRPAGAKAATWSVPLRDDGPTPVTYLDLSVAVTGFIYVLSYEGDGEAVSDYRLDIYRRSGDWMARTTGVAAARLFVDHWENVFTANWELLVGPDGRAEPSISKWIPSTPPAR